jgi:hypothetical protein
MKTQDPLKVYQKFRDGEFSESQSILLAEMFSDPQEFVRSCQSSLVLFRKLRDAGFVEKASIGLAEIYWSEVASRFLVKETQRSPLFSGRQ